LSHINRKTKPENPGLEGHLNPGFGFEKSPGYPGFRVRSNPGCKPYIHLTIICSILSNLAISFTVIAQVSLTCPKTLWNQALYSFPFNLREAPLGPVCLQIILIRIIASSEEI